MPTSIRIEKTSGVAIVTCSGVLRLEDARAAATDLWQVADWSGEVALWDFRESEFDLSAEDIREMARFVQAHQRKRPPERICFVTETNVDFGLSRMFEVFRESADTEFRVFRVYEDALRWVSNTGGR